MSQSISRPEARQNWQQKLQVVCVCVCGWPNDRRCERAQRLKVRNESLEERNFERMCTTTVYTDANSVFCVIAIDMDMGRALNRMRKVDNAKNKKSQKFELWKEVASKYLII